MPETPGSGRAQKAEAVLKCTEHQKPHQGDQKIDDRVKDPIASAGKKCSLLSNFHNLKSALAQMVIRKKQVA